MPERGNFKNRIQVNAGRAKAFLLQEKPTESRQPESDQLQTVELLGKEKIPLDKTLVYGSVSEAVFFVIENQVFQELELGLPEITLFSLHFARYTSLKRMHELHFALQLPEIEIAERNPFDNRKINKAKGIEQMFDRNAETLMRLAKEQEQMLTDRDNINPTFSTINLIIDSASNKVLGRIIPLKELIFLEHQLDANAIQRAANLLSTAFLENQLVDDAEQNTQRIQETMQFIKSREFPHPEVGK